MLTRSGMLKSNLRYVYKRTFFLYFETLCPRLASQFEKNCPDKKPQNFTLISKQLEKTENIINQKIKEICGLSISPMIIKMFGL
jgi:hypothetical protein